MPFIKFKDKDPSTFQDKGNEKGQVIYNFDVSQNTKKVEFEIQNFDCLGQNATYLVACEDGLPGFVKVAGKMISITQSKRGHAAEATISITGSDGVNTFTETFTLTFQHPQRLLQACADTI